MNNSASAAYLSLYTMIREQVNSMFEAARLISNNSPKEGPGEFQASDVATAILDGLAQNCADTENPEFLEASKDCYTEMLGEAWENEYTDARLTESDDCDDCGGPLETTNESDPEDEPDASN